MQFLQWSFVMKRSETWNMEWWVCMCVLEPHWSVLYRKRGGGAKNLPIAVYLSWLSSYSSLAVPLPLYMFSMLKRYISHFRRVSYKRVVTSSRCFASYFAMTFNESELIVLDENQNELCIFTYVFCCIFCFHWIHMKAPTIIMDSKMFNKEWMSVLF